MFTNASKRIVRRELTRLLGRRWVSTPAAVAAAEPSKNDVKVEGVVPKQEFPVRKLERFIPVTLKSLLELMRKDDKLLTSKDKKDLETFVDSLDAKYSRRFYNILEETKVLYDHLDPDKDTYKSQELSAKELMDCEYSLLQNVSLLLEMSNFSEIPKDVLHENLHDRNTSGIIVSVDPADYDLLQVWTKGHEIIKRSLFSYLKDRLWALASPRHVERRSAKVYTRVFLAVRPKGDDRVHLKVFKQIHVNELEHLLPKGKIKMSTFDKRFLVASTCLGVAVPLVRALPILADVQTMWLWGGAGLAAFIAGRTWVGYKNRRNQYLANLATTLYYKTVANNRGVLTLLCDRAQDEEMKEAILAYVFLLNPLKAKDPGLYIYDTRESLQRRVETWLVRHFKLENFRFDIDHALLKLDELGLLERRRHGMLSVAGIQEALASLPAQGDQWVLRRDSESSDGLAGDALQQEREAVDWR